MPRTMGSARRPWRPARERELAPPLPPDAADRGSSPGRGSRWVRMRVEATVRGRELSLRVGPGQRVDLMTEIEPGLRLGDGLSPDWYEEDPR